MQFPPKKKRIKKKFNTNFIFRNPKSKLTETIHSLIGSNNKYKKISKNNIQINKDKNDNKIPKKKKLIKMFNQTSFGINKNSKTK